ncbi:MAG: hypothetical protein KDA17_03860 [Candidatus Saccharibacteria bacterium]|nr:hypothetical protein [Candidatus Saccharibacteria bacterium]
MIAEWTVFDVGTGECLFVVSGTEATAQLNGANYLLGAFSGEDYYYDGAQMQLRPAFDLQPVSLTITTAQTLTINNIPVGTTVTHPDGSVVVDDGFIEWSATEPGSYEFLFDNFPYIQEVLVATVTSA